MLAGNVRDSSSHHSARIANYSATRHNKKPYRAQKKFRLDPICALWSTHVNGTILAP
jgi:hypothetical protein